MAFSALRSWKDRVEGGGSAKGGRLWNGRGLAREDRDGQGPESWGTQGRDRGKGRSHSPGSWRQGVDKPRRRVGVCAKETVIYGLRQARQFSGDKKRESKKIRNQGTGKVEGDKGREGKSSRR